MKFIYPAVFTPVPEGGYQASFPDLADCIAFGETLDDAIEKANEAVNDWINVELAEDDPQIPPVSDLGDIEVKPGQILRNIQVTIRFYEGWDE